MIRATIPMPVQPHPDIASSMSIPSFADTDTGQSIRPSLGVPLSGYRRTASSARCFSCKRM